MMAENDYETITRIAREVSTCMLTTRDADGGLRSRPMVTQTVEFDGDAWFFVDRGSSLAADIAGDSTVNAAYSGSSSWLSLSGDAELVEDQVKKEQLWNKATEAWFPDGPQDPSVVLVKVTARSAEYWDAPGGKPVALLKMAAAKVQGKRPEPGTSDTVNLG